MLDLEFDIAIGKHRRETSWRNRKITWAAFKDRLRVTQRTHELYAEYVKAKPSRQAEIKDVGGFVGGFLVNGRRKKTNVLHRQLITLDLDFANVDFWEDFTLFNSCAAVLYSTHKHSSATPRYRLVLPLDREVDRDEYEAIARYIAGDLNIELFDPSTFQPERLMYFPSTSKNGEYIFKEQDGAPICADNILAKYVNWRDSSTWAVSEKVGTLVLKAIKKQGDPTEKSGLIGAFCRTYTIHEAIEKFLGDVYEPAGDGRYTYLLGSTAAGVVTYDEMFAYSHHGSDPAGEKLSNAFDLVRLHLFGDKDTEAHDATPINKKPSFLAMQDLVASDTETKKTIGVERMESAKIDFADFSTEQDEDAPAEEPNLDWLKDLDADRSGNYTASANNLELIFKNDPVLKKAFLFDEFENRELLTKSVPWRKLRKKRDYVTDADDSGVRVYIENVYGITGKDKINDAYALHLWQHRVHPIREYLNSLTWDGVQRLDALMIDFMGAEDSAYTRNVTRKAFTAAVARVFNPGCKFDYILTLVGEEGKLKSTIFRKMGKDWFSDSFSGIQGREAVEQLQGVWILEIGELAGVKKAEVEATKHFIAKQIDRFRVAYGKRTDNFPRQLIFVATTNEDEFLQGVNGNRRFWIVKIWVTAPRLDVSDDLTEDYINQVWAEAKHLYEAGERTYLLPHEEDAARAVQREHTEQDDRADIIRKYLDTLLPENWGDMNVQERRFYLSDSEEIAEKGVEQRAEVSVPEIWAEALGGAVKDLTPFISKQIRGIMKTIQGWHRSGGVSRSGKWYGVNRCFKRNV